MPTAPEIVQPLSGETMLQSAPSLPGRASLMTTLFALPVPGRPLLVAVIVNSIGSPASTVAFVAFFSS